MNQIQTDLKTQLMGLDPSDDEPLHQIDAIGDDVLPLMFSGVSLNPSKTDGIAIRRVSSASGTFLALFRKIETMGEVPWYIGVYTPRDRFQDQISKLRYSISIGLGLILISVFIAIFLARRAAEPIKSTAAAALNIKSLNLDKIESVPQSRITELNDQADAFNQMLDGLKWFESYVPRQLVRRLLHNRSGGSEGSREAELTVMFTDIVGFTAMSENMPPAAIAGMLNEHFEILNACIESTGGTLDKYIGDATMAFWGAPELQDDHAARACRAALSIAAALSDRCDDIRIKIALHSGPLVVGNIGARSRMNYTVIGDTVNTCSRIEKIAGEIETSDRTTILISEVTALQVEGLFEIEPVGQYAVKGKSNTVSIYRLLGAVT